MLNEECDRKTTKMLGGFLFTLQVDKTFILT